MKSIRMAFWLAIPVLMISLMFPWVAKAQSNSIYSWTDENGVRHFSDTAPANVEASSQEMVPKTPTDPPGDSGNSADTLINEPMTNTAHDTAENTTVGQNPAAEPLSYADQQRKEMAERRDATKQKQAEREQFCLQARDQLARIEPSRRVFKTDEDGDTSRLDDEERIRMVEESKNQIAEFCD